MTSNVGQNYPYSSETEAERAARVAALVEAREGLGDKLTAETTPLDERERWWTWKCPTDGLRRDPPRGRLRPRPPRRLRRLRRDLRQDVPALGAAAWTARSAPRTAPPGRMPGTSPNSLERLSGRLRACRIHGGIAAFRHARSASSHVESSSVADGIRPLDGAASSRAAADRLLWADLSWFARRHSPDRRRAAARWRRHRANVNPSLGDASVMVAADGPACDRWTCRFAAAAPPGLARDHGLGRRLRAGLRAERAGRRLLARRGRRDERARLRGRVAVRRGRLRRRRLLVAGDRRADRVPERPPPPVRRGPCPVPGRPAALAPRR